MNRKNKGFLLIELLLVMVLLVLFGLTTFTLVISGSRTYSKLTQQKTNSSELRTALSFVNMKILQNETQGSFSIRKSPSGNGDALVINQQIGKEKYENWIYCSKNKLREAIVKAGIPPGDELSLEVVPISEFRIHFTTDKKGIYIEVAKPYNNSIKRYSAVVAVNTGS